MPCFGPLTLRQQFRLLRSLAAANARAAAADIRATLATTTAATWRSRTKWAGALALAALLLGPSALHRGPRADVTPPGPALPLVEEPAAFLGPFDEALSAGKLPEKFPDFWRKPPCPKAKPIVKERGACFLVLDAKPPCDVGYDDGKGRCLYPIAERQDAPRSIQR